MIGHWLLTLTSQEEDRVLLGPMARGGAIGYTDPGGAWKILGKKCLVQRAYDELEQIWSGTHLAAIRWQSCTPIRETVPGHYDWACNRFGEQRVNAAIRDRILCNRLQRLVQQAGVTSMAD